MDSMGNGADGNIRTEEQGAIEREQETGGIETNSKSLIFISDETEAFVSFTLCNLISMI